MISPLVVDTAADPRLVVVILHGRSMRAGDLAPFAHSIGVPARFVFPQATLALPGGGYAWWPIDEERRIEALRAGPRDLSEAHPDGRPAARAGLVRVLHEARLRAPDARVALVGFSQGGMLAVDTLLHEPIEVDALALFSSSCIALDEWRTRWPRLRGLPVLVTHGRADSDLALSAGERLRDELVGAGAAVQWLAFDGGHEIPLQVWRQLRKMLHAALANGPDIIRR